jgi:hypothetical protein
MFSKCLLARWGAFCGGCYSARRTRSTPGSAMPKAEPLPGGRGQDRPDPGGHGPQPGAPKGGARPATHRSRSDGSPVLAAAPDWFLPTVDFRHWRADFKKRRRSASNITSHRIDLMNYFLGRPGAPSGPVAPRLRESAARNAV